MRVIVYNNWYNKKHTKVLRALCQGIPGAEFRDIRKPQDCDIAVIFGSVKKAVPETATKRPIVEKHSKDKLIVLDSSFVLRKKYFAVGFGGIHGNADFRVDGMGIQLDRWNKMNIDVKPWILKDNGPMVVCGQLPRDANVQNTNHVQWCQETVQYYLDRNIPVVFRPHPRQEDPVEVYGIDPKLMDRGKMHIALQKARALVIWNSTSGVDGFVSGVPVISQGKDAMVYPYTSHDLDPKSLITPDRDELFTTIGYAQWTLQEMKEGLTWRHLTRN